MTTGETFEPIGTPVLPGSINSILEANPGMTATEATALQNEQLSRYQAAASALLGISPAELHTMRPEVIREGLDSRNIGEAA